MAIELRVDAGVAGLLFKHYETAVADRARLQDELETVNAALDQEVDAGLTSEVDGEQVNIQVLLAANTSLHDLNEQQKAEIIALARINDNREGYIQIVEKELERVQAALEKADTANQEWATLAWRQETLISNLNDTKLALGIQTVHLTAPGSVTRWPGTP
jgi:predicted RNase H-like nuclease (RuvC/YqgF family)